MSGGLRNFIHQTYKSAAEAVLKPRSESAFKEKGVSGAWLQRMIWRDLKIPSRQRLAPLRTAWARRC